MLAKAHRGEVELKFGRDANNAPVVRRFKLDANAVCEIENRLGKSISEAMKSPGIYVARTCLFFGLAPFDDDIDEVWVGETLSEEIENLQYIFEMIHTAMVRAMPGLERLGKKKGKGKKAAPLAEPKAPEAENAASP